MDEIGDYVLFRNFLSVIKKAQIFKGAKIILCGNGAWKQLSESLDSNYIDEFIWINKKSFSSNLLYRFNILKRIRSLKSRTVVNYSHSRKFYLDDSIVRISGAVSKFGVVSDLSNLQNWQIKISDKYYSKLISTAEERFEFYKNKSLSEEITGEISNQYRPYLPDIQGTVYNIPDNYILVSIGARFRHKRWSPQKFAEAAKLLSSDFSIVLTGSKDDAKYVREFEKVFNGFYNLTGRTSLTDLISLVKKSRLVISNDSGIVHIAAVLNAKAVVLHNGTHYGRFLPYPSEMKIPQIVIHPPQLYKINPKEREKVFFYRSDLDINSITVGRLLESVKEILQSDFRRDNLAQFTDLSR